jgi:hypothetical protein
VCVICSGQCDGVDVSSLFIEFFHRHSSLYPYVPDAMDWYTSLFCGPQCQGTECPFTNLSCNIVTVLFVITVLKCVRVAACEVVTVTSVCYVCVTVSSRA